MKKKNLFINVLTTTIISIVFFGLSFVSFFEKLDYRIYDSLFLLKKEPVKSEKIVLVGIDDASIRVFGEWPWSRDVIADALFRMKELNANYAVFDIEYISPSKFGISPNAEGNITSSINNAQNSVEDYVSGFTSLISSGQLSSREVSALTDELIYGHIRPTFNNLDQYINSSFYRDNDEYFAQALQFFGKSYLTVNNRDLGYEVTKEEIDYIRERFLTVNVTDEKSYIDKDNKYTSSIAYDGLEKGFQPALKSLLNRSYGLGFTNSVIDSDGVRRRFELLYNYDGKVLMQLVFSPLLDYLDVNSVTRIKHYIVLNNALIPGKQTREDIKIPVDSHGCILLNFRHGKLYDCFNSESIINLIQLDSSEANIVACLNNIRSQELRDSNGALLPALQQVQSLLDSYRKINDFKNYLLGNCTGFDTSNNPLYGISDDEYHQYFSLRKDYYNQVNSFINGNYYDEIKERLSNLYDVYKDENILVNLEYFEEDFSILKDEYDLYNTFITEMRPKFNGAFCIIGNIAASTTDLGATPFQQKFENVGLHATLTNTILTQSFIRYYEWYYGFIPVLVIAFLLLLLVNKPQRVQNGIGGALLVALLILFSVLFVVFDLYIPFIGTLIYFTLVYISGVIQRFIISNREKKFITQVAASFANKDIVEQLKKHPEMFTTKGEKKEITALFSDVQKFSTLSENLGKIYGDEAPGKLVEILNEYLGDMSNMILENNGTIDKYEGDAIISMFGAPDSLNLHNKEDWAFYCLDSAIKMKKQEKLFNETHKTLFDPHEITLPDGTKDYVSLKPLQTRIGINSGFAFVGMMGSQSENFHKLNYTMMGDTVNLASRLEGVNKAYGTWIMCSEDTWNFANASSHAGEIIARRLDKVRVVGRSTPVQLYNVLGYRDEMTLEQLSIIDMFHSALDKYLARDFITAGKMFLKVNEATEGGDQTSLIFAERCKKFIENGVDPEWDGVVNMTSK